MAGAISQDVIEKIIQQAAEEAALICSFTRDIDWLKNELRIISGGLNYANSLLAQDDDVKDWLRHARDVAWDAEDIVEEFVVYNRDELFSRDKMAKKIQEVKERSRFITKYGKQLKLFRDLVPSPSEKPSSSPAWKENSLLLRDSHPVAIEPKLQHLISLLDESTVPVIAVVGIGGTGKTFLLQNLFDRIKQRYEHSIWLSMSQSYSVHKLQCDLASHMGYLKDAVKDASEKRAAELIHADLQKTKSLIVLDDVWRATREDNVIRSLGLPIGHDSQCKIVVTTRNRGVGQNLEACIYEMELLSEDESWQLFCAYAFSNYNGDLPPHHLKAVAHEVEKQCGRLPLALKTIAASLSGCTEPSEWNSKLSRLKELELHRQKEVTTPDYRIIEILRLSYDSLPAALKPCFSYLSFFPEVERIDCEYLVNLWIVEGFVPQGEDQWDVAWGYLYQLANLCLLEVWEDWGLIKYCKIHDLLYDLAIEMSKENRCSFAVEDVTSVKRILLAKQEIDDMVMEHSRVSCPRSLRTLLLYKNLIERIEINFFSPMRLLRVLDLSESNISTLPDFVGKLKLLRLLNLSSTKIKEIPICVRSLKSLVFLDLCHCQQLQTLPEWINDLRCLQHLNIKNCNDELRSHMPKGISELVSLRVLRSDPLSLSVEEDGLLKLGDVIKLNRLQELSLEVTHEKELKIIEDGILAQLLRMRYLSIESHFSIESHLPHNITALQDLQTLCLGKFAVPSWVWMLTNLRQLTLFNCDCIDYPALETMPNLIELRLEGNKSCRKVPKAFGKSSGFPKLRFLIISDFPLLEELPDLEDGAMAVLEKFHLVRCPRVKKVPEGLKGLRGLLDFYCGMKGTDAHLSQPSQKEDIAVLSNFSSPPQPSQQQTIAGSSTTMETDFMSLLKKFDGISQANDLIQYIEELLKNMSGEKSEITPRSPYIKDGQAFMEIIEKHIAGLDKTDLMNSVTAEIENEVMEVLKGVGKIQCVGAALSMVGFALEISRQMSKSYQECFELLKDMFDLGKHILCLNEQMAEHKQMLNESLQCIVMGCIMCVSQSRTNIFRYLTASVNAESLQDFRHKINLLYADLKLLRIIEIESRETKIPPPSQEFHTFVEYKHRSDEVSVPREKHRIFLICYESDCIRTMVDKLFKSLNAGGVTVIVIELLQWEMAGKKDLSLKQVSEGTDIHFPIFSKENYLRLLEQWLCICRPNSIIRPLFYDTNEDIKCQFDKTLNKLAYKQDSTAGVFSSSSNAPLQMSFLPGWSSLDYRTEWRLVKRVVFDVLEMLNNLPLPLPLHAVGLEERMEDLIGKLKMESDTKNMVVAISGVGGIGKTTLAKAIFDSIGPKFQARSLVGPVKAKELCKLQEHILKDLSRQDILVKSIEHGKALMKAHLGSIRALVILDDIDHSMQLEAFNVDCLAPGSRLIITSRDTELLAFAHADKIYDIAQLRFEQSVELFSWHAFLRTDPDDGYEDRSKKIAKSCQGIPLLLEVAGASLYDRTETSHWDESIRNLESSIDQNIHRRLCVSAQGLESREIEMFLDIVCFFGGKESLETALRFWEAIGHAPNRALEKLIQNSLVRIDDKNQFIMHDLLQDMGRAMVADNYPGIGERRRSWRLEDAEVITKSLGTMSIQGFSISGEERSNIVLQEESFASMTNLQLLWIAGEVEKTDFLNLCPDLRWLRWKSSPLTCLPSEWSVEHLTVLDLSSGTRESPTKLRELWSERSLSKEFENLSVLRLSSAQYLERLPDFSAFPALTVLDLEDCPNLTSIPDSIGILGGLKCLNLSWCRNLVKLPDGISKLSSLEKLSLSHCISLKELPSAMEELMALKELDIGFARHIQELPNFGKLLKLESLTLAGCLSISFLPDPIGELNNLKELDIQFLGLIQKLPSLRNLLSLKKLIISGCESLRNLPESLGELRCLQYLEMNKCSSIDCLPEKFRDLVHLEELYMNDCPRFLNFPSGFENLLNLRILEMRHNPSLMQLPSSISKLPSLVWFDASDCNLLDGLHEGIGDLLPLGILNLENNFFCQLPSSIFKLTNLTKLNLNNCHSLEELPTLPQGIVELDVGSCTQLIRLPCMSDLKRLTTLMLCNCEKLIDLPELSSSQCLAVLNISKCINIRSLEGVEGLNSLKTFYSGGSGVSVSNLNQHIEDMPQLEEVCILANGVPQWLEPKTGDHCLNDDNFTDILYYSVEKNAKCGGIFLFFVVNFVHEYYTPGFPSQNSMELAIIADNQESIWVTIFSNRQNVEGDQLYICVYRETHFLVRRMEAANSISVRAKGRNIQVRECGMQLLYNGTGDGYFQRLVKDLSLLADSYTSKTSEDEVDALDDIEDKARDEEPDSDLYDYGYASSEGDYQAEEDWARCQYH